MLRRRFAETGFWDRGEGTLLIWSRDEEIVGHIEFFTPVSYWDAFELSYQLYDERHAGHGYTTEAAQLLVDYLCATKKQHRIHLVVVPGNEASIRIAEKCGVRLEGRCAVRSSTPAATTTCCSTRFSVPIRGPGTLPPLRPIATKRSAAHPASTCHPAGPRPALNPAQRL